MAGTGQTPGCHQHHGNSHDRIFGAFGGGGGGETPLSAPGREAVATTGATSGSPAPRRRRRWVRTRTQHLSSLSLNDDLGGDRVATIPPLPEQAGGATTENATYGAPSFDATELAPAFGPPCGRYAYRRPDGNPVTGEGYGQLDNCDLQAAAAKK